VTTAVEGKSGLEKYAYYIKNTKNVEKVADKVNVGDKQKVFGCRQWGRSVVGIEPGVCQE